MRALISVSDKTGIIDFAKGLRSLGWKVIATGGTMKLLQDARPTEPMMFNGMAYISDAVEKAEETAVLDTAKKSSATYLEMITSTAKQAIENGI